MVDSHPYGAGGTGGLTISALAIMQGRGLVATADSARLMRYKKYLDFDSGKHDVGRLGAGARAVVGNYARVFVRKAASYLFPAPVIVGVDAPDGTAAGQAAADRAQRALAECGRWNDLDVTDLATAVDAGVLGDGAYKVTWDREYERVRVVPVDVQTLTVTTAGDDVRRVVGVRQAYTGEAESVGAMFGAALAPGEAEIVEEWTDAGYRVTVGDTVVRDGANPYGFIPYEIFPNSPRPHEFWGESDLAGIMEINAVLDRRLSVLNHLLELSGSPVTVLENVDGSAGIAVGPGAVWNLPEGSRAYLLDLLKDGAIGQHLAYIELLYRVLHDVSEMPRSSFGDAGTTTSGIALAFVLQPLIQKTHRKRLIWTRVYEGRARKTLLLYQRAGALDLGGYRVEDLALRVIWPDVLPTDTHQTAADAAALYGAGILSLTTAQRAVGVEDPEREQRAIERERSDGLYAAGFAQPDPQGAGGHGSDVPVERPAAQ